jgi:hypothetical protein
MIKRTTLPLLALGLVAQGAPAADPAPFDLAGPALRVSVTHDGVTLPIAQVPNLAEGDRISIQPDLPADQSAHYLLVAAFLRGATNPPPEKWFYRAESWTRKGRKGMTLTVPQGARQLALFLAPETGGDFSTLRNTVRAQPGAFVRASQDLNQASLDRSRLDTFLGALRSENGSDPAAVQQTTATLASALSVKLNPACLDKMPELQAACLMQNQDALLLSDGHSNWLTDTLTGPGADLALQLSATPQGGLGFYSPYIGAIRDIIGIFGSLHTAKYQYVPALKTETGDRIGLVLNAAPSFRNPKSVIVTTLPAIAPPRTPPLRLVEPNQAVCAGGQEVEVPVGGAPLVFSTGYLHDVTLRVQGPQGKTIDLPAKPDVSRGAFIVQTGNLPAIASARATLHGLWGFQPYEGPSVELQRAVPGRWQADEQGRRLLVVGRADPLIVTGGAASCVRAVAVRLPSGETRPVDWKAAGPNKLALTVPLADAAPGNVALLITQEGLSDTDSLSLRAFAEASQVDDLALHEGDIGSVLTGHRLDQVESVVANGVTFRAGELSRTDKGDALTLATDASAADKLRAGQSGTAKVQFRDGRSTNIGFRIGAARPRVDIVSRAVSAPAQTGPVAVRLTDAAEVPKGAKVAFALRMANGRWSGDERIEVAPAQSDRGVELSLGQGLSLQDAQVAVATLDTTALPPSTFGPLRLRVRDGQVTSDWQDFATLLRLPQLHQLSCPSDAAAQCELSGDGLYLIQAIGSDPTMARSVDVPDGYVGNAIKVPRPAGGTLYLRLRDDPKVINQIANTDKSAEAPTEAPAAK